MLLHDKAFYGCAFFLLGVFLFSIFESVWIVLLGVVAGIIYFLFIGDRRWIWFLPLMYAGAVYFQLFGLVQESALVPYGEQVVTGVVTDVQNKPASQEIVISLKSPNSGKIKIYAKAYPKFFYGSNLEISGLISEVPDAQEDFFLKEGIFGISKFPGIKVVGSSEPIGVIGYLMLFRGEIIRIFDSVLPPEKSALLAGMTIGVREGFTKEFKEKMSLSGTTHIVALSGYNISIISILVSSVFAIFLTKSASFYLTVVFIGLFVALAGAEASAVRAAIMGILALFAKESQRQFSMKNAIIFSAAGMVLINPRILVFDLGFQLSFAALLGIVYIFPILEKISGVEKSGILKWKENALTTFSAQLAVLPLLLGKFGTVSLTSIFANILILEAVPLTMGLGFAIALAGLFSDFLAKMIALPASLILGYEIWVIEIFTKAAIPFESDFFSLGTSIVYYLVLFGLVYKYEKKQ